MSKPIIISCIELCDVAISGIPRYMREVIINIDKLLEINNSSIDIRVCYPKGKTLELPELKKVKKVELECKVGERWNTGVLKKYVQTENGIFCGLANNVTTCRNSIIALHDVRLLVSTKYDRFGIRFTFLLQAISIRMFAKKIVTVSEFQKEAICKVLHVSPDKVSVTYNGYEHINRVEADEKIFEKYSFIRKGEYYYALGSIAKHKNYIWIVEVAKRNPDKQFVIAGGQMLEVWGTDASEYQNDNIVYVGYVTDEENKALMKNCKAFLQPSLYEGFGIPPLEALALGRPIFVSNATCLPEIYEGLAVFFEPNDYTIDLEECLILSDNKLRDALEKYSWKAVALRWLKLFEQVGDE